MRVLLEFYFVIHAVAYIPKQICKFIWVIIFTIFRSKSNPKLYILLFVKVVKYTGWFCLYDRNLANSHCMCLPHVYICMEINSLYHCNLIINQTLWWLNQNHFFFNLIHHICRETVFAIRDRVFIWKYYGYFFRIVCSYSNWDINIGCFFWDFSFWNRDIKCFSFLSNRDFYFWGFLKNNINIIFMFT